MKITESKLRRILRNVILEFGEKDHELRQKLQNRERMIGIGMDAGTMPFNPTWDYDKKPAPSPQRFRIGDELSQVQSVIESNDMYGWLEVKTTRDPNVIHLTSGDEFSCRVENDYGTFVFSVIKPRNYKWSMECESIDDEIDNVLYELGEYVTEMENS